MAGHVDIRVRVHAPLEVTWRIANETDSGGPAGDSSRHSPGHDVISWEPERNRITYRIATAPDAAGQTWSYHVERTTNPSPKPPTQGAGEMSTLCIHTLSGSTPGRGPSARSGACATSRWPRAPRSATARWRRSWSAAPGRRWKPPRVRPRRRPPVAPWTQPPWRSRRPPVTRDDRRGAAAGAHHRHRDRQRHRRERRLVVAGTARRQVRDRPHQAIRRVRPAGEPCRRGHAVPAAEGDLAATACQERSVRALRARGNGAGTRGRLRIWPRRIRSA